MKQFDMFGNEVEVADAQSNKGRSAYKTMQELYGEFKGFNCGTCKYCEAHEYNGKTYYKCWKWIVSNSSATDIRLKDVACKKYAVK